MKIFIDADGSPVVENTIKIAKQFNIHVVIVKNYAHEITSDYAEVISVDISNDSADFYIVNRITKGDIVVTQDYGLSALALAKEAICINQNGIIFDNENINSFLNTRHIHSELRRKNKRHSNTPKRNKSQDELFEINLRNIIEKSNQ